MPHALLERDAEQVGQGLIGSRDLDQRRALVELAPHEVAHQRINLLARHSTLHAIADRDRRSCSISLGQDEPPLGQPLAVRAKAATDLPSTGRLHEVGGQLGSPAIDAAALP